MNKIIALVLLTISPWTMAATQFFKVTAAQPNLTITPTLNATYAKAGIKINSSGFKLQNPSCTANSNGFCVFSVGPTTPKTLQISGAGILKYTLCLNAECQQQCQDYTANFSGSSSTSTMSYIGVGLQYEETNVQNCVLNTNGSFGTCNENSTLPGGTPWIALNTSSKVLYVGTTVTPGDVKLFSCVVKTNGSLGTCTPYTEINFNQLYSLSGVAFNPNNKKLYVAEPLGALSRVITCSMNSNGIVTFCDMVNVSFQSSANGLALNTTARKLYISQGSGFDAVDSCSISPEGTLGACVPAATGFSAPAGLAYNSDAKKLYVANSSNGTVASCTVNTNGSLGSCTQNAASGFSTPTGLAYNASAHRLYVTNFGTGLVSSCLVNTNGSLGTCTSGVALNIGTTGITLN